MVARPGSLHAPIRNLITALESLRESGIADIVRAAEYAKEARACKRGLFFVGNGGSAAIASHMAADWLKNGNVAAQCFNDGALTTCLSNDLGYDQVFAKPLSLHGRQGDVLFAISSSGNSPSILNASKAAYHVGMYVVTLSGFRPDNPLRNMGDVNFYVPSDRYGIVEVCHHAICHAILDTVIEGGQ